MSENVLDEAIAIRDALKALKKVSDSKVQYRQMLTLGYKLVLLVYTYKLGEQHSDSDRYTRELRTILETLLKIENVNQKKLKQHFRLLRWYARQIVRVLRGLINNAPESSNGRSKK